jgi:hypothetical protein
MGRFKRRRRASLLAGSGPDLRCLGPVRADLARAVFFLENVLLFCLFCKLRNSIEFDLCMQMSSLDEYLSDGIGLIFLEAL